MAGRKKLPKEERRTKEFRMRVNDFEKRLIDETGTSTSWRFFMVNVAIMNKTVRSGLEFHGEKLTPESFKWAIGNLFFDVFEPEGRFFEEDD